MKDKIKKNKCREELDDYIEAFDNGEIDETELRHLIEDNIIDQLLKQTRRKERQEINRIVDEVIEDCRSCEKMRKRTANIDQTCSDHYELKDLKSRLEELDYEKFQGKN